MGWVVMGLEAEVGAKGTIDGMAGIGEEYRDEMVYIYGAGCIEEAADDHIEISTTVSMTKIPASQFDANILYYQDKIPALEVCYNCFTVQMYRHISTVYHFCYCSIICLIYHPFLVNSLTRPTTSRNPILNLALHLSLFSLFLFRPPLS